MTSCTTFLSPIAFEVHLHWPFCSYPAVNTNRSRTGWIRNLYVHCERRILFVVQKVGFCIRVMIVNFRRYRFYLLMSFVGLSGKRKRVMLSKSQSCIQIDYIFRNLFHQIHRITKRNPHSLDNKFAESNSASPLQLVHRQFISTVNLSFTNRRHADTAVLL